MKIVNKSKGKRKSVLRPVPENESSCRIFAAASFKKGVIFPNVR